MKRDHIRHLGNKGAFSNLEGYCNAINEGFCRDEGVQLAMNTLNSN